jgi:hypothetical protein
VRRREARGKGPTGGARVERDQRPIHGHRHAAPQPRGQDAGRRGWARVDEGRLGAGKSDLGGQRGELNGLGVAGVAPNVTLVPVKTCDSPGFCYASTAVAAITPSVTPT